ncbi:MAG: transcription termination factor Rho [Actinomycetaceae bacterium]|nr:transcription termination factor Rho [Actinomycetaceae bacterium]
MRISQLRALAEELGIQVPEKAKKPELIAAIREVRPARRGRPPKNDASAENPEKEQLSIAVPQQTEQTENSSLPVETRSRKRARRSYGDDNRRHNKNNNYDERKNDNIRQNNEGNVPQTVDDIILPERSQDGQQGRQYTPNKDRQQRNNYHDNKAQLYQQNQQNQQNNHSPHQGQQQNINNAQGDNSSNEYGASDESALFPVAGILDKQGHIYFLRTSGYLPGPHDVLVPAQVVRDYALRRGDAIEGSAREPQDDPRRNNRRNNNRRFNNQNQVRHNQLVRVERINHVDVSVSKNRPEFNKLTPLYPQEMIRLETNPQELTSRSIDLIAPIGKGQRGLIVSPPKAGKTTIMQRIAMAIEKNSPDIHLMVVLVDERPEEVTDMKRLVKGEVIASTFDRPAHDHTVVAELAIERAKRLVEYGNDVVVLLDSLTRLSRAYNLAIPPSGRILSGGVDAAALYPPKKFFGAARNIEGGGSLTIIASALVETGSKMDEVIFEEFKGTGNMELRLSRELADRRIFPAIDINASGTRREDQLYTPQELKILWQLRRTLGKLEVDDASDAFLNRLRKSKNNADFLMSIMRQIQESGK